MSQENRPCPDFLKPPGSIAEGATGGGVAAVLRSGWLGILLGVGVVSAWSWRPEALPAVVVAGWLRAPWALRAGLVAARGTELRGALAWGALVIVLGAGSQLAALAEPLESGRPAAGLLVYLMSLAGLAALVSVLNARTPGGGAWAILTALLVVVFLIPWLEGGGLGRASWLARLRLENPWNLFYGLLVVAGVTNFLPTRFGGAGLWLAFGFGLEALALSGWPESRPGRAAAWSLVSWGFSEAACAAARGADRPVVGRDDLERLWLWFRDHWGVVWGLRVLERFNRAAEGQGWDVRLGWQGVQRRGGNPSDGAATALLKSLLRRFAREARLDEAAARGR